MASNIDPTKPAEGAPTRKADLRASLTAAREVQLGDSRLKEAAAQGAASGTVTIDYDAGRVHDITASGNFTGCSFPNWPTDATAGVLVIARNWGAFTVTWPAGTRFAGKVAPALTASGEDWLTFVRSSNGMLTVLDILNIGAPA